MLIKWFFKKILYREKSSSDSYIAYLRAHGVVIGEGTRIFDPLRTCIDLTRPYAIEIGDNVQITSGVTILTHGYDWSVLKHLYGEVLSSYGKVEIGSNVFIGVNTTILKGVEIGCNTVIGANSVVNKNLPGNGVYAGNPARFIMPIDDYYQKRKAVQFEEARAQAKDYHKRFGKLPPEEAFHEFFFLFEDRGKALPAVFDRKLRLTGNYRESCDSFFEGKGKMFETYDDFLNACGLKQQP